MTAAGWKLREMQGQDEGHDHGHGENGAEDKTGVGESVSGLKFGNLVHGQD